MTSFRNQFVLHRAAETLGKLKEVATALTIAGSRFAPLAAVGVVLHGASLAASWMTRSFEELARGWTHVPMAPELGEVALGILRPHIIKTVNNWHLCDAGGIGVLVFEQGGSSGFYVERDPAAFLAHIRDGLWSRIGNSAKLVPVGRWGDHVDVLSTLTPDDAVSERADNLWARCEPLMMAGKTRSVLLIGPPGTGKSTVARALARRTVDRFGGRVLRIGVADFSYLRPSVIDASIALLNPDVVLVDDLDRFMGADSLLDVLEAVHGRQRLLVATVNNEHRLCSALVRPGRFDLRDVILGVGEPLARRILGGCWGRLDYVQQQQVARWPAAHVRELADRLEHLPSVNPTAEFDELAERVAGQKPQEDPPPTNHATAAKAAA